jgi:hypothetical protein
MLQYKNATLGTWQPLALSSRKGIYVLFAYLACLNVLFQATRSVGPE